MSEKKIFNVETLIEAIKEVAEVISENGGAEIKAVVKQMSDTEIRAHILIEPYLFISKAEREAAE